MTPHPAAVGGYPVEGELAAGGVVYVARDTRLDRPVAITVLSAAFAGHPEHLARFDREAKLPASLNHPDIGAIDAETAVDAEGACGHVDRGRVLEEGSMSSVAAVLIVFFSALPPAVARESQDPKSTVREVVTMTGTVERTDRSSRALTLRTSQNTTQTIYVAPEIAQFDELRNGDRITVRLYESVIVAVRPGLKPSVAVDTTASANPRDATGQVLQQIKAAVTVESVDRRNNAIAYKTADNRRVIRTVADPRLLEGVKAGDVIEITHTRERVIDLQRVR